MKTSPILSPRGRNTLSPKTIPLLPDSLIPTMVSGTPAPIALMIPLLHSLVGSTSPPADVSSNTSSMRTLSPSGMRGGRYVSALISALATFGLLVQVFDELSYFCGYGLKTTWVVVASFVSVGVKDDIILGPHSDIIFVDFKLFVWWMLLVPGQCLVDMFFVYFVDDFDPIPKPVFSFLFHFAFLSEQAALLRPQ